MKKINLRGILEILSPKELKNVMAGCSICTNTQIPYCCFDGENPPSDPYKVSTCIVCASNLDEALGLSVTPGIAVTCIGPR